MQFTRIGEDIESDSPWQAERIVKILKAVEAIPIGMIWRRQSAAGAGEADGKVLRVSGAGIRFWQIRGQQEVFVPFSRRA